MISRFIPKSSFARNVITLITGTSIAQAIPIAISPILTRLYTPEEFGVFALYLSIVLIISVFVTGRYELAITLPKKDGDAVNIVALSICLTLFISGILLIVFFIFNNSVTSLLGSPAISNWLYFVPVSTLLTGIYQSLTYWSNRKRQYKRMAMSRVMQGGGSSAAQLAGGYSAIGASGLVGGQIIGQALSTGLLVSSTYREDRMELNKIRKIRMYAQAKKYLAFPKYLIVAHGFNTASSQMPVILLGSIFSSGVAGFYMLTQRVIEAPMSLVASAIADVFRQEASHAYAYAGNCRKIYLKTLKRLSVISILPFSIFFFIAPDLFAFVFGDKWKISGTYAQILTPMFFLRFITSPLSYMFIIAQRQRIDLAWNIGLFSLVLASFFIGYMWQSIEYTLIAFCSVYCLMYIVSGVVSYKLAAGLREFR